MQLVLQRKFGCRLYFLGFISCKQAASPVFGPGTGRYPSHDPWNRPFSKDYCKSRWVLGGQLIAGGFTSVLEGIQGDQDFIRILFSPSRPWNQYWCLFIPVFFSIPSGLHPGKSNIFLNLFAWPHGCKYARLLFEAILLLLLQSMSMGLCRWQRRAFSVLVHQFWTAGIP